MRIGFLISTRGGSPLQVGLERGLRELGHYVEDYQHGQPYDLIILFNQTSHCVEYEYLQWPPPSIPVAFVDSAEYGYFKRLPGVIDDYWNAFAVGSVNHDTKNRWQQKRLKEFLEGRSFPYFLREFSDYHTFPANYHPIDYPTYAMSVEPRPPDREEYLRRDLDLFVSWGASHPWRLPITQALRDAHVKAEIHVLEEDGWQRMPQFGPDGYFERTRAARCSVSFDGYGSGSFRMNEVLQRTLLLMGPLTIQMRAKPQDGIHCLYYDVVGDGEAFISTNVADVLRAALADPDRAFELYQAGYYHCNRELSEKATARYVLDTVAAHDWSAVTQL